MTLIALVRHGQTDWNLARRIQGTTDIPLNDTGREQAREAAERLRVAGLTVAVSSPLSRAAETARIIATALGLPAPQHIPGLAERDYGSAEGISATEMMERFPHGVPDAEPEEAVVERIRATLHELADRMPHERIVAASHGGVIGRLLRAVHHGEAPSSEHRVVNGSIWLFDVAPEGIAFVGSDPACPAAPTERIARSEEPAGGR